MLHVPVPVLWLHGFTEASETFVIDFTGVKITRNKVIKIQIKIQPKGTRYSFKMKSQSIRVLATASTFTLKHFR